MHVEVEELENLRLRGANSVEFMFCRILQTSWASLESLGELRVIKGQ